MFFLASLVLTLRFLQSRNLNQINTEFIEQENKISNFREKESTLVLLKDRLTIINKLTANPSKQKVIYDAILGKVPSDISISSVILDTSGNLTISASAGSASSLSNFFTALSSKEAFKTISAVNVESLSRGRDGVYRVIVRVLAKK